MSEATAAAAPPSPLFALRVRDIWRFLKRQPVSYWLFCIYLFFEYVRPQTIYPAIDVVPWSLITIIACLIVVLIEGKGKRPWTIIDTGMVIYTAVVLISSVFAFQPAYSFSYEQMSLYYVWLLVYFLMTSTTSTQERFFVFLISFLLYNLKMSQHAMRSWAALGFGFSQWSATGAPGWFQNPGEMGVEMTMFLPISFMFYVALKPYVSKVKQWILLALPITALGAIAASSSRGSQLAVAAVGLWYLIRSRHRVRGLLIIAVTAFLLIKVLPSDEMERFSSMGSDQTSQIRLTMWKNGIVIAEEHPIFGIGYRNWLPYYRTNVDPGGILPHNIFVEAGAELGYTGLAAFLFLIAGTIVVNQRTRKMARKLGAPGRFAFWMGHGLDGALIGFLASGFFVTVLYYPFFWVNLGMTVSLYIATKRKYRAASRARVTAPVAVQPVMVA